MLANIFSDLAVKVKTTSLQYYTPFHRGVHANIIGVYMPIPEVFVAKNLKHRPFIIELYM